MGEWDKWVSNFCLPGAEYQAVRRDCITDCSGAVDVIAPG